MTLVKLSALDIASKVRSGEISAIEVLNAHLEHIKEVDGCSGELGGDPSKESDKVHAFISVTADRARNQAALVDAKIKKGEDPGVLAGVPVTIKDIFCVADTYSTAASKILANFKSPYTATAVHRWEKAGAVVLGKVNLDEFTYGSSNESSAFQPAPRNPWDTSCVPGGSSGGSAAAVAAYEGPISLGTDTAGSIRLPAAYCGVVGLKPTYGRVSRYGLIAFGSSLDCPGPLTRSVSDSALALGVMAGADERDATAATVPVPDYLSEMEKGVKGLKIGLSNEYFRITYFNAETGELEEQELPQVIKQSVLDAAEKLSNHGAEIVEHIPMPHTKFGIPAYFVISRVEAASNLHRFDGVKYGYTTQKHNSDVQSLYRNSRAEGFGLQPKLRILMGMYVSAAQYSEQYYNRALRIRSLIRKDFDDAFQKVDTLLTPSTPTSAFKIGGIFGDSVLMQYADQLVVTANHAGIPGISIPAGFGDDNMPIGIHYFAPDFREDILFRCGFAYEQATSAMDWRLKQPQVINK